MLKIFLNSYKKIAVKIFKTLLEKHSKNWKIFIGNHIKKLKNFHRKIIVKKLSPKAHVPRIGAKRRTRCMNVVWIYKLRHRYRPLRLKWPGRFGSTTPFYGPRGRKWIFWDFGWCQVWPLNDLFKSFWPPSVSSKHPPYSG